MHHDKRVKDKSISLGGSMEYVATVKYFQDDPQRDGDVPVSREFVTLEAAQIWLGKFPRDAWTGYSLSDYNYKELDERKKNERKRKSRTA